MKTENATFAEWVERFGREAKTALPEALRRAGEPVEIFHTDETGEWQWVVSLEDGFWMDAFETQEEAESFVTAMGWPMIGEE